MFHGLKCVATALLFLAACASDDRKVQEKIKWDAASFKEYWYAGSGELSRYHLKQARYGEVHEGDAVLIFVTEDFLRDRQVKRDFGNDPADSVLKLNARRDFNTGLYNYSLMTSVFTKVDFEKPQTSKITFSGQDWCGQVFAQMNHQENQYFTRLFSYFQSEGDQTFNLPEALLEDEIWTRIRIAPHRLPTGALQVIPSFQFARLRHRKMGPYQADATLEKRKDRTFSDESVLVYELTYRDLERTLSIFFEKTAPFSILGWREVYPSGFGENPQNLVTTAVRTHRMMTDYWNKHGRKDRKLRKELGLEP